MTSPSSPSVRVSMAEHILIYSLVTICQLNSHSIIFQFVNCLTWFSLVAFGLWDLLGTRKAPGVSEA